MQHAACGVQHATLTASWVGATAADCMSSPTWGEAAAAIAPAGTATGNGTGTGLKLEQRLGLRLVLRQLLGHLGNLLGSRLWRGSSL